MNARGHDERFSSFVARLVASWLEERLLETGVALLAGSGAAIGIGWVWLSLHDHDLADHERRLVRLESVECASMADCERNRKEFDERIDHAMKRLERVEGKLP